MNRIRKLASRFKKAYGKGRILYALNRARNLVLKEIFLSFLHFYYRLFRANRIFVFNGKTYKYFYHKYNTTWRNERCVEIPIIWEMVKQVSDKRILEVGNVLPHYFRCQHDVLDQYEKAEDIINEDVVNFKPTEKYDLVISISTMEHVGFDCHEKKDSQKILKAFENLMECLKPGGRIVVTMPLGFNSELDKFLKLDYLSFTEKYFLRRISQNNSWEETNWDQIREAKYNVPFSGANAIILGIINK